MAHAPAHDVDQREEVERREGVEQTPTLVEEREGLQQHGESGAEAVPRVQDA